MAARPCILNVDDDDTARTFKSRVLESAGYRTLEARTGMEALVLAQRERPALVQQLQLRGPVPALYMSGYAGADLTRALVEQGASLLQKPFTQASLLEAVRGMLDRGIGAR